MAVANYHDTYGSLPPAYVTDASGRPLHSWRVLLLPFLEQAELYEAYDFSEPWDGPHNRQLLSRRPAVYAFHDAKSKNGSVTNYLAVLGDDTVWPFEQTLRMDEIEDGPSSTILVIENRGSGIGWTEPRDFELRTMNLHVNAEPADGLSSRFQPPAVVTADGHVHTVPIETGPETLHALLTARGGEDVRLDEDLPEIADGRDRPRTSE